MPTEVLIEQTEQTHMGTIEVHHQNAHDVVKQLPKKLCSRVQVSSTLDGRQLVVFAKQPSEIEDLRKIVQALDVPVCLLKATLYVFLVQDRSLDEFLSGLLSPPANYDNLSDYWKDLLFDMQKKGEVMVIASPHFSLSPGYPLEFSSSEEIVSQVSTRREEKKQLLLDLKMKTHVHKDEKLIANIELLHLIKSPYQSPQAGVKEKIVTTVGGHKGELLFIGEMSRYSTEKKSGHWSWLSCLPAWIRPNFYRKQDHHSKMMVCICFE